MQTISNGGYSSEDDKKMGEDPRLVQIQNGLHAMADLQREKDFLQKQHEETVARCRGTQAELDALNLAYQRLLGEIEQYRRERDEALARERELEARDEAEMQIEFPDRRPSDLQGSE